MRPDQRELDDELRGHLALEIQARVDRGEDPAAARRAALADLGYTPAVRESMRRVWYGRWFDAAESFANDLRVGLRSLGRARGLTVAVVATLALGIGANAAIFTVVKGVLLRPLVNRDEDRLVYIRQSATGLGSGNMTFSVPEIDDITSRATSIGAFGDFSTAEFAMVGIGEPRMVRAGVVSGDFFDVMGLRPALGRLVNAGDDGPDAESVAVLTHRFWAAATASDPAVVGRTIRLGPLTTTIVGVLEPSVPYPADTEIIANVVTSPHHLEAEMVTGRTHRMTELFGRLTPGATLEEVRTELAAVHADMMREHPAAYPASGRIELTVTPLREQIASPARPILLLLLAAAGIVFVIACSNVANLILARSVRREGELAVRAALGASRAALRRTLLAESLMLCGAGAVLGLLLARPLVTVVSNFAARFSIRATEVTVDASLVWVGVGLAMAAAVLLAFVPRLPHAQAATGPRLAAGGVRVTAGTTRRLRAFAMTQVACSFVLLAGAGTLLTTLIAMQTAPTSINTRDVLALDVPPSATGVVGAPVVRFLDEATRRIAELPGVTGVAAGSFVPWRDAGSFGPGFQFDAEGYTPPDGGDLPHGRLRLVSPGFFSVLGVPLSAGRDFTDGDRAGTDPVVIVSESLAAQMFSDGRALDRTLWWTDPVLGPEVPLRIVGIVPDVDDEHIVARRALTIYHPVRQLGYGARLFVQAPGDPYGVVPQVTKVIHEISAEQPVERPATLGDIRGGMLAPERLNALVVGGFAAVALLIAVVGLAGVLAFGVSARTREFGVRLAVGSSPRRLLAGVLLEGLAIVTLGVAAGAAVAYGLATLLSGRIESLPVPGVGPLAAAAAVLIAAGVAGSLLPASRASRVDVLRALRSE